VAAPAVALPAPTAVANSGSSPFAHMFEKQNANYTALFGSTLQE
jgi:hypothetical protein